MKKLLLITLITLNSLVFFGCAKEQEKIVVPVAGQAGMIMDQKNEMIEKLRHDFPKLKATELDAFSSIARYFFVNDIARHRVYDDVSLPIGSGQASLRFSDMAFVLSELNLQPADRVLEIGTGSGYFAAILSRICTEVYSVEIIEYLYEVARQNLERLKITNVRLRNGNGLEGYARFAPYDVVIFTAAVAEIPQAVISQLTSHARVAAPMIDSNQDTSWVIYHLRDEKLEEVSHMRSAIPPAIIPEAPKK
ncbi:MAG: methyltransferase domain-containing protein [Proteobacteria bacterium]|nr:methyltransferase domain-containing protein [Pseudomonadota bacterium]